MKRKKLVMAICLVVAVLLFHSSNILAEDVTLTIATINPHTSILGEVMTKFGDLLDEKSNGTIKAKVFLGGQLGDASSLYQAVIDGNIDIIQSDTGWFAEQHPVFDVLECNYLFKGQDHYKKVLNTRGSFKFFEDKLLKDPGLRTVFYVGGLERDILSTYPINSIEDLEGKTMRSKSVATNMEWWELIGARPVPVSFSELYTAIQTGVVNGSQNSLDAMINKRLAEVAKNVARTQHNIHLGMVVMNEQKFSSLTEKQQKTILETGYEVQQEFIDEAFATNDQAAQKLEDEFGVTITYPDKEPFIEASRKQLWDLAEKYDVESEIKNIFE